MPGIATALQRRPAQGSARKARWGRQMADPSPSHKRLRLTDEALEDEKDLRAGFEALLQQAEQPHGTLARAGLTRAVDSHGGYGLFATRDLPSGFELRVPRRFVLDAYAASRTTLGRALGGAGFTLEEQLVVVLAAARHAGSGPYCTWAATLPTSAPDAASWPASAKSLLGGTDLGAALALAEEELQELQSRLAVFASAAGGESSSTLCGRLGTEELRWARGMCLSRRFPAFPGNENRGKRAAEVTGEVGRWGMVGSLIPLMDLLNHSAQADPSLITFGIAPAASESKGEYAYLRNLAPLRCGEQAFTNYGRHKSNEELLASYGFAVSRNPADRIQLLLAGPGVGSAAPGADSATAGAKEDPAVFSIERDGEISLQLWRALNGQASAGDDDSDEPADEDELVLQLRRWVTPSAVAALRNALGTQLRRVFESGTCSEGQAGEAATDCSVAIRDAVRFYREGTQQVLLAALDMIDRIEGMLDTIVSQRADGNETNSESESDSDSDSNHD